MPAVITIDPSHPVGVLAARMPTVVRVLEDAHIDYHTAGSKSLREACEAASASVDRIVALLEVEARSPREPHDWTTAPLSEVVAHLVEGHHAFTRELLRRAQNELGLARRHHSDRKQLGELDESLRGFAEDLLAHLEKEEAVLFPHILGLEQHRDMSETPFTSVDFPLRVLNIEHESAEDRLAELRALSDGYFPPPRSSASLRAVFADLAALERDLHEHIHLENNVLFPRALEIERSMLGPNAPPPRR